MSKKWRIALSIAATVAALAGGAAAYAHADKTQSSGSMMHGGSGNMMGTGQMSQMMESCNKMMQDMMPSQGNKTMEDMTPSHGTDKPKAKPSAERSK